MSAPQKRPVVVDLILALVVFLLIGIVVSAAFAPLR